jgi:hypothetical protein
VEQVDEGATVGWSCGRVLGQRLLGNGRERRRRVRTNRLYGPRLFVQLASKEIDWARRFEGQAPRQHPVEQHAE